MAWNCMFFYVCFFTVLFLVFAFWLVFIFPWFFFKFSLFLFLFSTLFLFTGNINIFRIDTWVFLNTWSLYKVFVHFFWTCQYCMVTWNSGNRHEGQSGPRELGRQLGVHILHGGASAVWVQDMYITKIIRPSCNRLGHIFVNSERS